MDDIGSSYQFHCGLESPVAFVRREWRTLAICGGIFVLLLCATILAINPAFFYPRLEYDSLLYYLKGRAFLETGHAIARTAVNRPPFQYVAMPGILRSPFIAAFDDFDDQIRAIQLANVVLAGATAVMFSYVLSWTIPRTRHWMAIAFTFTFMLLSPLWVANVFNLLADIPYAASTIAEIVIMVQLLCSDRPLRRRPLAIVTVALLFGLAFLVRFTAPVLLLYIGILAAGRATHRPVSRRFRNTAFAVVAASLLVLIALNWEVVIRKYLPEPLMFVLYAPKKGMMLNLLGLALPSQIIPDFQLALGRNPVWDFFHPVFGSSPADAAITAVGVGVSLVFFYGMWQARRRFLPEVWYFFAALPVLTLMIQSTSRYFMAYQPFIWIFFYVGASRLFGSFLSRALARGSARLVTVAILLLAGSGLVYLRLQRTVGAAANRPYAISFRGAGGYVAQVSSTFGDLRHFLETLPRDRATLVTPRQGEGRWNAIARLNYYRADSALSVAAARSDMYVVLECGTMDLCEDFGSWDDDFRKVLGKYGDFSLDPVFDRTSRHAKARVYRLKNRQ